MQTHRQFLCWVSVGLWTLAFGLGPASVHGAPASGDPQTIIDLLYYDSVDEQGRLVGGRVEVEVPSREALTAQKASPVAGVLSLRSNGPTANRIDLVTVGDGYQAAELDTYDGHVNSSLSTMFAQEPFRTYANFFNIHRIDVVSVDSGVDHDPDYGIYRNTALDMGFWCDGIERLLCVSVSKAYSYANNAPDVDMVLAVANSTKYGGAGYTTSDLATVSGGNGSAPEVAIHEFGHSLGDLADEYDYGGPETYTGPEPPDPNVSILTASQMQTAGTKWAAWLGTNNAAFDGFVSTYEGAAYSVFGIYRPTNNSKMRSLGRPFNLPSVEALVIEMYQFVDPIDDATQTGPMLGRTDVVYTNLVELVGHSYDIEWRLDGDLIPGATGPTLDISTLLLLPGTYTLSMTVTDNTTFVRNEAARAAYMTDGRTWTVQILAGDLDSDGDVDLTDYAGMIPCVYGPNVPLGGEAPAYCLDTFNFDFDFDVDLADVAVFQREYTGECPTVATHPVSQTVCEGDDATFSVVPDAGDLINYQWRLDDVDISGATASSYTVYNTQVENIGDYSCELSNYCGQVVSDAASLSLSYPPAPSGSVPDLTKCEGERATFVAQFSGDPPFTYQWEKDGLPISGATDDSYTIQVVTLADAGAYRCQATNLCDSAYSNEATLTVDPAPIITDHPDSQCVEVGETAVFSVTVDGTGPFFYKWYKDDVKILQGEGVDTLTIDDVQPSDAGEYRATVQLISAPECIPETETATLTVGGCGES